MHPRPQRPTAALVRAPLGPWPPRAPRLETTMTQQEVRSRFNEKVKRGMFQPVSSGLTGPDAEDRLQDGICQTYEMFERYALEKDRVLDDGILVHPCKERATDLGRRFVRDGAQPARDVLHPRNFTQGKVEVYRLDGMLDDDGDFVAQDEVEALVPGLGHRAPDQPAAGHHLRRRLGGVGHIPSGERPGDPRDAPGGLNPQRHCGAPRRVHLSGVLADEDPGTAAGRPSWPARGGDHADGGVDAVSAAAAPPTPSRRARRNGGATCCPSGS